MYTKVLYLTGRILMGIPYLFFGLAHIVKPGMFVELLPDWVGGGYFWVYVFGAVMCVLSLSVMTGKFGMAGSLSLAVLLVILMSGIHIPHMLSDDPAIVRSGIDGTFKDIAMIGGYLALSAYFSERK